MIKSLRAPPPPAGKPAPPTAAARAEDHVATVLDGSATTWARIKAASDLGREIEVLTDMNKSRKAGFTESRDSRDSFFRYVERYRAARIIP